MKWTIRFLSVGLALSSCKGTSSHDMELLTNSPWRYEKASFNTDDDQNSRFDALDPQIMGFIKDYSIVFRQDGTGALKDTRVRNKQHHGPDSMPFIWSFQNKDSLLYFQDQYYRIQTLSNDRLIIYSDHKLKGFNSRYTVVLKH